MAKAASKPTRTLISSQAAIDLVAKVYRSPRYAEQWLIERWLAGHIDWEPAPGQSLDGFRCGNPSWFTFDCAGSESSLIKQVESDTPGVYGPVTITALGVQFVLEEIERQLPARADVEAEAVHSPLKKRRVPTQQDIIRDIAKELWPPAGDWQGMLTFVRVKQKIADKMKKRDVPVPSATTFRRAFGLSK